MNGGQNLLKTCWQTVRWWWLPAGWLWFLVAFSAVIAARANHPLSDWYELLWNVLAWTVIATALVLASTGTARLTARLLKWPWTVAAATVLLIIAQLYWGAYLAFYLATYVHLWAGGSL